MKTSVVDKLLRIAVGELGTGFRSLLFHAFRILPLRYYGSPFSLILLPYSITAGYLGLSAYDWLYSRKPKNPI